MDKMNICMFLEGYFPPDIRVEKEAEALLSAGHRIFLISQGKKGLPAFEKINNINVIRVRLYTEGFLRTPQNHLWSILFKIF